MNLVEIDRVDAQALEARFARFADVLAGGPTVIRSAPHRHRALGGEDDLATSTGERLAANLFRSSVCVDVRSVDEVPARVEKPSDQVERGLFVASPARRAECHGSQAKLRDTKTASTERAKSH